MTKGCSPVVVSLPEPKQTTSLSPLPTVTGIDSQANLRAAAKHLLAYVTCVKAMLTTGTLWKVSIPVKNLLTLICTMTSVAPDSVVGGWTPW